MKTNITIYIVVIFAVLSQAQTTTKSGFYLHYKQGLFNKQIVTVRVQAKNIPETKEQLSAVMDEMSKELQFDESGFDALKFWMYMSVLSKMSPELNKTKCNDYYRAYFWLIEETNYWLRDQYWSNK